MQVDAEQQFIMWDLWSCASEHVGVARVVAPGTSRDAVRFVSKGIGPWKWGVC